MFLYSSNCSNCVSKGCFSGWTRNP